MFGAVKETASLSEFGKISTGSTPPMKVGEYYENKDIPFFRPSDMTENVSFLSHSECFIDKRAESISRIFERGSVLTTCIGSTIGKVGIANLRGSCNQQINFIEPNSKVNPVFIAYAIHARKEQLIDIAHAPVVPIINKTEFSKFQILRPPLALQNEFAAFVEQLDKSKVVGKMQRISLEKIAHSDILSWRLALP